MKILVGVPTFNNSRFGYSIRRTLEALAGQSFRDFRVLIVYRPSPGDRTLDVIDEFRDRLDIEVKIQSEGFFEEAMNMIFETSRDYDITLTTDDDAIPTTTWIEEHINMHKQHEKIGIFQGTINGIFIVKCTEHLYALRHLIKYLLGYYNPILPEFKNYVTYINDMGLLACNDNAAKLIMQSNRSMYYNGPGGVNMSFKSKLIDDFKLPGITIRGIYNEVLLMLHYIVKHSMHSALFNGGIVIHVERDSLSRPKNLKAIFMSRVERGLLPYMVNQFGIKVNLNKLKKYHRFITLYSGIRGSIIAKANKVGIGLAIEAIENNYEPNKVRDKLIELNKMPILS